MCFQEKHSRLVRHFHFHGWPEIGIPSDGKGMIDLIAAVQKQQQQSGNHPIVVHCRYAYTCTHTLEPRNKKNFKKRMNVRVKVKKNSCWLGVCPLAVTIPLYQHYYLISRRHRIFWIFRNQLFYSFPGEKLRLLLCKVFTRVCFGLISAGAGRTGTFIALSNILERVKAEGLLDVFQTVKSLRTQRPHMVQTVVRIHHTSSVLSPKPKKSSVIS